MLALLREFSELFTRSMGALGNASQVFINKALNAIVPLLLIPYLNTVFGVEKYGELVFVQAIATLLTYVTDFGFGVTATREVSIRAGSQDRLSELVSSVLVIKVALTAVVFAALLIVTVCIGLSAQAILLYCLAFGAMALQNFMPSWFFQGMRKNAVITLANLASKVLLVGLLVLLVREGSPLWIVPFAEAVSCLVFFAVGLYLVFGAFRIAFRVPSFSALRSSFFLSLDYFLVSILIWITTGGLLLITEAYVSPTAFGYFATFTRIVYYVFAIIQPVSLAVFPYVSEWYSRDPTQARRLLAVLTKCFVGVVAMLLLSSILFAKQFFSTFFDEQFNRDLPAFMPAYHGLMLWVALVLVTGFIGMQYFVARRRDAVYRRLYVFSTALAIVICFALLPWIGILATSIAMVIGEAVLLVMLWVSYKRSEGGNGVG